MLADTGSKWYALEQDMSLTGRWYLSQQLLPGQGIWDHLRTDADSASQTRCFGYRREGKQLDFTLGDFDVPVVSEAFAKSLGEVAGGDVSFSPAKIEGANGQFFVLRVTHIIDAIDEARSELETLSPDELRQRRGSRYRSIQRLVVNQEALQGHCVARLEGWKIPILVDAEAARAVKPFSGVLLRPV